LEISFADVSRIGCARLGTGVLPLVAIVGRYNVGKSTLFNRLTHSWHPIVSDEPGITRDRIYDEYEWAGRQFRLETNAGVSADSEVDENPNVIPMSALDPTLEQFCALLYNAL